ncbi:MAG: META domain-containing protein [Proteobacteria bacterium]|nr:META domain-containing protein [Pseudomonadota bacterium]
MKKLALTTFFLLAGTAMALANGSDSLKGTAWGLANDTAPRPVQIVFGEDGRVSGSLGCNRFGGVYIETGTSLTFGGLFSTRMACPEPGMSNEHKVSEALSATQQFEKKDGALILKNADGGIVLELVPGKAE